MGGRSARIVIVFVSKTLPNNSERLSMISPRRKKTSKPNSKTSYATMAWQDLLTQAQNLQKTAGSMVYDRVQILVKLESREDFQARYPAFEAHRLLSSLCQDLIVDYRTLKTMLEVFPKRADWADGKLVDLKNRMLKQQPKSQPAAKKTRVSRVGALQTQVQQLTQQNKQLQSQLSAITPATHKYESSHGIPVMPGVSATLPIPTPSGPIEIFSPPVNQMGVFITLEDCKKFKDTKLGDFLSGLRNSALLVQKV